MKAKETIAKWNAKRGSTPFFDAGFKAFCISVLFLYSLVFAAQKGFLPYNLFWIYLGFSLLTFIFYAWDKTAAQHGWQRRAENTLHLLALFGGWPGALYASQKLRHKSSKRSFRIVFWLTLVLNLAAIGYLLTPRGRWLNVMLDRLPLHEFMVSTME